MLGNHAPGQFSDDYFRKKRGAPCPETPARKNGACLDKLAQGLDDQLVWATRTPASVSKTWPARSCHLARQVYFRILSLEWCAGSGTTTFSAATRPHHLPRVGEGRVSIKPPL